MDQADTTYFLYNIGQNTEKLHVCTSCIIVCLQASTYIVGIAFTPCDELNVNGVMVAVVPTLPESIYMLPLITIQMQQIVNCILPMLLRRGTSVSILFFIGLSIPDLYVLCISLTTNRLVHCLHAYVIMQSIYKFELQWNPS